MIKSLIAVAVLPALLGACAAGPDPSSHDGTNALLDTIAADAGRHPDVSGEQLAIVEAAADAGALDFADYAGAIDRTLACFDAAGIVFAGPLPDESLGYPTLGYAAQVGPGGDGPVLVSTTPGADVEIEVDPNAPPAVDDSVEIDPLGAVAERCRNTHSAFVEAAYMSQATSIDSQDAALERKRPEILACATEHGIDLDSELPIRQLLAQLVDAGEDGRQCLARAEITAF